MLLNPYKQTLPTIEGTNIITETLGIVGLELPDTKLKDRVWVVHSLLSPTRRRTLGGIRVKLVDNKGFITFCNQRDFEVLLGIAKPGDKCIWASQDYAHPLSDEWYGYCADDTDLFDDLHERELRLRQDTPTLPAGLELERRIHFSDTRDVSQLDVFLWDMDRETGISPDPRLETIEYRWACIERQPLQWQYLME